MCARVYMFMCVCMYMCGAHACLFKDQKRPISSTLLSEARAHWNPWGSATKSGWPASPRDLPGFVFTVLRLHACAVMPSFMCRCPVWNSGPHVCVVSTLPTEPFSQKCPYQPPSSSSVCSKADCRLLDLTLSHSLRAWAWGHGLVFDEGPFLVCSLLKVTSSDTQRSCVQYDDYLQVLHISPCRRLEFHLRNRVVSTIQCIALTLNSVFQVRYHRATTQGQHCI